MKRLTAVVCAAAMLLAGCGNNDSSKEKEEKKTDESSISAETETSSENEEKTETETETTSEAETTTESEETETTKASGSSSGSKKTGTGASADLTDLDDEAAEVKKVYDAFIEAVEARDSEKLAKYSDLDVFYGDVADSKTLSDEFEKSDMKDQFYQSISGGNTAPASIEKCDEDLPLIQEALSSEDLGHDLDQHFDVDSAYKVGTADGGYVYVLRVNGEWKADVAIAPYIEISKTIGSLGGEWEAMNGAVAVYTQFMVISQKEKPVDCEVIITSKDYNAGNLPSWLDTSSLSKDELSKGVWALRVVCSGGKADAKQVYYAASADSTYIAGYPEDYTGNDGSPAGDDLSRLFG